MRIISGTHRGRKINPPKNLQVRPTTDLAKESLFNILNNFINFDEINVLDLFAGTGNISLEFASRGSVEIISVDKNYRCVEFIKKVTRELNFENVRVVKADVFRFLKNPQATFDLIFADPPYSLEKTKQIPDYIFRNGWLKKNAWLIIEHPKSIDFTRHDFFTQQRTYGRVNFSFFENV